MSRSKCTKELYNAFLEASAIRYSGLALSEVSPTNISHDSISRWLQNKNFKPKEIWELSKSYIIKDEPCLLIADDTIIDKQYSKKMELVHYQYSGNIHDVIPGIGLVNLVWHGLNEKQTVPIDYRIYDKPSDGKTKNNHFIEMLKLAQKRGLNPEAVVVDSWYSGLKNLKAIRDMGWVWISNLKKNRKVNRDESLENLLIPDEGLKIHLRGYGWVTVFKFVAKNGRIDYISTNMGSPTVEKIHRFVKSRWSVEVYHRELKQSCGLERCQARTGRSQRNHICLSIITWLKKYKLKLNKKISFYRQNWENIKLSIKDKIKFILLNPSVT